MIRPHDQLWEWPRAFVETGLLRMIDLGRITRDEAALVRDAFARVSADPHAHMVIPSVVELVATKPLSV
jgi:hypothetical protein